MSEYKEVKYDYEDFYVKILRASPSVELKAELIP